MKRLVVFFAFFLAFSALLSGDISEYKIGKYVVRYNREFKVTGYSEKVATSKKASVGLPETGRWSLEGFPKYGEFKHFTDDMGKSDSSHADCIRRLFYYRWVQIVLPDGSEEWWFNYDGYAVRCSPSGK